MLHTFAATAENQLLRLQKVVFTQASDRNGPTGTPGSASYFTTWRKLLNAHRWPESIESGLIQRG